MTYLLDTGVWLRAVNQRQTIPSGALRVLQAPRATFGLAAISLWEVGKKVQVGKLPLPKDLAGWFADALAPNLERMSAWHNPGGRLASAAVQTLMPVATAAVLGFAFLLAGQAPGAAPKPVSPPPDLPISLSAFGRG